jgi:hypothetical protein
MSSSENLGLQTDQSMLIQENGKAAYYKAADIGAGGWSRIRMSLDGRSRSEVEPAECSAIDPSA